MIQQQYTGIPEDHLDFIYNIIKDISDNKDIQIYRITKTNYNGLIKLSEKIYGKFRFKH